MAHSDIGSLAVPACANSLVWTKRPNAPPSLRVILLLSVASYAVFVSVLILLRGYLATVDVFGDNVPYMAVASAIRRWSFEGLHVQQFWGLPYLMAAISLVSGISDRAALLLVSFAGCFISVTLAHRLWGGWIAGFFAVLNFEWLQRSFLGGAEPLFVALLFGTLLAARKDSWMVAAVLASLSTLVRPVGFFALLAIGITLLGRREFRKFVLATLIGLLIGGLYAVPIAVHFGSPFANLSSYRHLDWDHGSPVGWPFAAIVRGTILYPVPWSNLLLTYGWILLVLAAALAMIATKAFRKFAQAQPVEGVFAGAYLGFLYTYNSSYWARGCFLRFAIPIVPFVLLALERWVPKDRRLLWTLGIVSPLLAAASAIGVRNVLDLIRH